MQSGLLITMIKHLHNKTHKTVFDSGNLINNNVKTGDMIMNNYKVIENEYPVPWGTYFPQCWLFNNSIIIPKPLAIEKVMYNSASCSLTRLVILTDIWSLFTKLLLISYLKFFFFLMDLIMFCFPGQLLINILQQFPGSTLNPLKKTSKWDLVFPCFNQQFIFF